MLNFEKVALEKGYLHKIVRKWLSNLQQMCVTILRTLGVMYETKYQNFGMQFATNLRNAPC